MAFLPARARLLLGCTGTRIRNPRPRELDLLQFQHCVVADQVRAILLRTLQVLEFMEFDIHVVMSSRTRKSTPSIQWRSSLSLAGESKGQVVSQHAESPLHWQA